MSLLDLEEFALSDDLENVTDLAVESIGFEGEGIEQKLEDLPKTMPDEDVVEDLLSTKLMNGFMLIDKPCPKCLIPLVKKPCNQGNVNISTSSISSKSSSGIGDFETKVVDHLDIVQIPKPIKGIPFCVICESYVLTCHAESQWLERLHAMQILGSTGFPENATIDTGELEGLGEKLTKDSELAAESPSNWMNSPANTSLMPKGSEQVVTSPIMSVKSNASCLFKTAFSNAQQKRKQLQQKNNTELSPSFDSNFCQQQLEGKRLVGKVASEDEGIEMNLEADTVCNTSIANTSVSKATTEQRDDNSFNALWKFVGSSHGTARDDDCEVSLNESDQEPNFGILSNDSVVDSEHGGDCSSTEEDPDTRSTLSQHFAAEAGKYITYDADQEEDDSCGSPLEIVSHSIHYIETDKCSTVVEKEKSGDKEDKAEPEIIRVDDVENEKESEDAVNAEVDEAKKEKGGRKEPVTKASLQFNIDTVDSEMVLEQTLKWEKENLNLDKTSTCTGDIDSVKSLEDLYCSDADVSKQQDNGLAGAATQDTDAKLQQQLESEIKMQAIGDADSLFKEQPGLSMLEELGASDDSSTAEIVAALDQIEEATLAILQEVKAKKSMEESVTGECTMSVATSDRDEEDHDNHQEQSMASSTETPMNPPSTVTGSLRGNGSMSSVTASTKSGSTVDSDIMQEYAVRRDIATKVLGTKMLQGYTLKESQCNQCGMPEMEFKSIVHCVVCPVLARKAKKELRKKQKLKEQGENSSNTQTETTTDEDDIVDEVLQQHEEASTSSSIMRNKVNSDEHSTKSKDSRMTDAGDQKSKKQKAFEAKAEELRQKQCLKKALMATQKEKEESSTKSNWSQKTDSSAKKNGQKETASSSKSSAAASKSSSTSKQSHKSDRSGMSSTMADQGSATYPPMGTPSPSKPHRPTVEQHKNLGRPPTPKSAKARATRDEKKKVAQKDYHHDSPSGGSIQSQFSTDSLCVASQAPDNIKSADARRKKLAAKEQNLLEQGVFAKEIAKEILKSEKPEDQKRLKEEADKDEELRKSHLKLIVETKRLETMERMRLANEIEFKTPQESMLAVYALQEERKRLRKEARRQKEIRQQEDRRREAEMERRRKRAEQEAELIDSLERQAQQKAREAEEAVAKANAAMEQMKNAKKGQIKNAIAQGDADTVAETEAQLRAEAEGYYEETIQPSESFLWQERWETLRLEGRSVMTRRLIAGWTMLPMYCEGVECQSSPLLQKAGRTQCVVCGGSGSGNDGAYMAPLEAPSDEEPPESDSLGVESTTGKSYNSTTGKSYNSTVEDTKSETSQSQPKVKALETVEQIHEDFEEKRRTVSKEIGRRMLEGWTLLDMSCPNCVMPLLTDEEGENEICVLCGVVGKLRSSERDVQCGLENTGWQEEGLAEAKRFMEEKQKDIENVARDTTAFLNETEAVKNLGKQLEKTSALIKPGVEEVVAMIGKNPCSPQAASSSVDVSAHRKIEINQMYSVGSLDSAMDDLGITNSLSAHKFDDTSFSKYSTDHKFKELEKPKSKLLSEDIVPLTKDELGFTSSISVKKLDDSSASKGSTENNFKKEPEKPKPKKDAPTTDKKESKNQDGRSETKKKVVEDDPDDEDTYATFDSMLPMADSVMEFKQVSPKQKVKKGAAAIALEKLKGKRGKQNENGTDAKKKKAVADKPASGSGSFAAGGGRARGALKQLTIDTSAPKCDPGPASPATPMTPRSPIKSQLSSPRHRSSPMASPRHNILLARDASPRGTASPRHAELHDRLHHLLANPKSPTKLVHSRGSKSEPNSPAKRSLRRFDPPDHLVITSAIAERSQPRRNSQGQAAHEDPPAMSAFHVGQRRIARDPEDRSIVTADDDRSIISSRSMTSRSFRTPRVKPFPGMSPQAMGRRSPFKPLASPIRRMKEDNEGVTLVIPKDFDVTNDAQLRDLILAAKKGVDTVPNNNRLALQGRIKTMGNTEIIDVIDLELTDDEDEVEIIGSRAPSGDFVPESESRLPSVREARSSSFSGDNESRGPSVREAKSSAIARDPDAELMAKRSQSIVSNASSHMLDKDSQSQRLDKSSQSVVSSASSHKLDEKASNLQVETQPMDSPRAFFSQSSGELSAYVKHAPSPGEKEAYRPGSQHQQSPHGGKDIVVSRMHPPSPGESPSRVVGLAAESPLNNRPRRRRPKVTPESMMMRSNRKPRPSPSSAGPHSIGGARSFDRNQDSPRSRIRSNSSHGSHSSSLHPENVAPETFFSSSSASGSNANAAAPQQAPLANMSFSSTSSSRYSRTLGGSASSAIGLPPISPRKSKRGSGSFSDTVTSRDNDGGNTTEDDTDRSQQYDTASYSSGGNNTGISAGRSTSFDRSIFSGSTRNNNDYSSSEDEKIRVLNSESLGSGIEVSRKMSYSYSVSGNTGSSRSGSMHRTSSGEVGLINSSSFDGIIDRLDTYKSKLTATPMTEGGDHSSKTLDLIEKLARDAADISTVGERSLADSSADVESHDGESTTATE